MTLRTEERSERPLNVLRQAIGPTIDLESVGALSREELLRIPGCGVKSATEILARASKTRGLLACADEVIE